MGRKVGKNFYFKKKFCPIFYFMTHLFPTAQKKKRGVEAQGHNIFNFIFYLYVLLNQIRDNHIFTKDWEDEEGKKKKTILAIKFTESAAFCRVGRVTGNNNKFLLGLIHLILIEHNYLFSFIDNQWKTSTLLCYYMYMYGDYSCPTKEFVYPENSSIWHHHSKPHINYSYTLAMGK